MREFFQPFRRQFGAVTLLVACLFMAGWIKSLVKRDFIEVDLDNSTYRIGSMYGDFRLIYCVPAAGRGFDWTSEGIEPTKPNYWRGYRIDWRWNGAGFDFGAGASSNIRVVVFTFPYWSIVLPLMAISACLMLTKPRAPKRVDHA